MSMKKVWIVAVFALAAVSCVRMEDISCDGVESVEVRSLGASRSLVEVSVRASNASGAAVSIVRADLTLDRGETTLLRASVDEKVRLPRRSEEATVRIPVEIRFEGGLLGALGTMGTLSSGARGTTVSGEVVLKAGMMRKKYKVERMGYRCLSEAVRHRFVRNDGGVRIMKRKFWIVLLPLCGCFCAEAGAQSLSALKSELSTPDPSYGSRVEVEEHDGAASAVRSMEGRRAPEKYAGIGYASISTTCSMPARRPRA